MIDCNNKIVAKYKGTGTQPQVWIDMFTGFMSTFQVKKKCEHITFFGTWKKYIFYETCITSFF